MMPTPTQNQPRQSGFAGLRASAKAALAAVVLSSALAACGPGGADWRQTQAPPQSAPDESGYLRPPQPLSAERGADGAVVLRGRSDSQVRVRLSSPDNIAYGATARDSGDWAITTPADANVRLFGVAEDLGGREVQGEGYVAILPGPGPAAALLRAGGGTVVLTAASGAPLIAPAQPTAPQIMAVDFDVSGAAVVSGLAPQGAVLHLFVDNAASGGAKVGVAGRFAISLSAPLKPGEHDIRIDSAGGAANTKITADAVKSIVGLPYHGQRQASGWRVDWVTPGGGVQTTLIISSSEP
jgi:hypothetical protein